MSFDDEPRMQSQIIQMLDEAQVDPSPVRVDDVASSRPDFGAISYES